MGREVRSIKAMPVFEQEEASPEEKGREEGAAVGF